MHRFPGFALVLLLGFLISIPMTSGAAVNFEHGSIFGVGLRACTIASGDLDGDGDLDLAVANIAGNSISIAYNDGEGNFPNVVELPLESGRKFPVAVAIGNLDGSGNIDMAAAFVQNLDRTQLGTPAQSGVILFYAETDGTYTQIYQPVNGIPSMLKIDDLDGDGDNDLLIGNNGEISLDVVTGSLVVAEAGFYYFENKNRGLFSSGTPKITDGALVDFLVYDFDQNGFKDIIGANQGYPGYDINFNYIYQDMNLSVFRGSDSGLSDYDPLYFEFIPWTLDKADFNKDGYDDIVMANVGDMSQLASFLGTNASINIFENKGNRFNPLLSIPTPGMTFSVLSDDFDLDGDVDIIATVQEIKKVGGASSLVPTLRVYENDGNGNYSETDSLTVAEEPRSVVKGDFDKDGDLDIAVLCTIVDSASIANALNGEVYVFINNAVTSVSEWTLY